MRRVLGSVAAAAGPAGLAAFLWATAPESAGPELRQLLPVSDLIQAFPAFPRPQPPGLWLERMPESLARKLWQNKTISWFQIWGEHAGAPPYLMLRGVADLDGLPHSLRLGDYRLVAADSLSLQSLQKSLDKPPSSELRCEALAGSPPALFWQGESLAQMLGSWTPLADPLRWGCLKLRGDRFWGQVSAEPAPLTASPQPADQPPTGTLSEPVVLRVQGRRMAPILQPLLDALSWPAVLLPHRDWLLNSPFRLELRRNSAESPYRASLWLRVWPANRHRSSVARLQRDLETQQAPQWPLTAEGPIRRIERPDGSVQAGWRWFPSGELLVVLGSGVPLNSQAQSPSAGAVREGLEFSAAPAAMQQLAVLPVGLPPLWGSLQQLDAQWQPANNQGGPAQLAGSLTWPAGALAGSP